MKYLKENLNTTINFVEKWANNTKFLYEHNDHLAEQINVLSNYLDYIKKGVNDDIGFTEQIAKKVSEHLNSDHTLDVSQLENKVSEKINVNNLDSKIDNIIESVKKQKAEKLNEQSSFPYFKLLTESNQREFLKLENNQKQKVIEAVANSKPMNEKDFMNIWYETLNPVNPEKILEKYVSSMPEEYKPIWENLEKTKKDNILSKTKFYKMDTPYQINFFWHSIKELHESLEISKLNESSTNVIQNSYGSDYMKKLTLGLQRLK